jgi:hypothetical protein
MPRPLAAMKSQIQTSETRKKPAENLHRTTGPEPAIPCVTDTPSSFSKFFTLKRSLKTKRLNRCGRMYATVTNLRELHLRSPHCPLQCFAPPPVLQRGSAVVRHLRRDGGCQVTTLPITPYPVKVLPLAKASSQLQRSLRMPSCRLLPAASRPRPPHQCCVLREDYTIKTTPYRGLDTSSVRIRITGWGKSSEGV